MDKASTRLPAGPHASKSTWLVLLRETYGQTLDRKEARAADLPIRFEKEIKIREIEKRSRT